MACPSSTTAHTFACLPRYTWRNTPPSDTLENTRTASARDGNLNTSTDPVASAGETERTEKPGSSGWSASLAEGATSKSVSESAPAPAFESAPDPPMIPA